MVVAGGAHYLDYVDASSSYRGTADTLETAKKSLRTEDGLFYLVEPHKARTTLVVSDDRDGIGSRKQFSHTYSGLSGFSFPAGQDGRDPALQPTNAEKNLVLIWRVSSDDPHLNEMELQGKLGHIVDNISHAFGGASHIYDPNGDSKVRYIFDPLNNNKCTIELTPFAKSDFDLKGTCEKTAYSALSR